mmetsp:Transcript_122850/g.382470  ORF Transcript_122850/g.382470 Transcript_122850/m.382470 type:complete len:213 (-) Transcript_122850:121-759(-)
MSLSSWRHTAYVSLYKVETQPSSVLAVRTKRYLPSPRASSTWTGEACGSCTPAAPSAAGLPRRAVARTDSSHIPVGSAAVRRAKSSGNRWLRVLSRAWSGTLGTSGATLHKTLPSFDTALTQPSVSSSLKRTQRREPCGSPPTFMTRTASPISSLSTMALEKAASLRMTTELTDTSNSPGLNSTAVASVFSGCSKEPLDKPSSSPSKSRIGP